MKKYLFLLLSMAICFCACKKGFLDVEDNSVVLAEQYVTDLNTTQHYLNGVYLVLGRDFYHGYNQVYPDLVADNIKPAAGKTTLINPYNWNQSDLSGTNMNALWQSGYQLARSCNFAIDKASEFSSQNPSKSNQIMAEAYSIRALVHFVMVNVFAQSYNYTPEGSHPGIPYVTAFDWTKPVARSSVAEVYSAIINDLNKAIDLFSAPDSSTLVMNKNAAKALLARCYLFKEDWQLAKNLAIEVTNAVPLMTGNTYPSKLFTLQEKEALFQIIPSSTTVLGGSYNTVYQGRLFNGGSSSLFLASSGIANLLRQNPLDVRKNWVKSGGAGKDTIIKYPVNVITGFNPTSNSYYPTIFRSSEMFLTIAESSAKLGDDNSARSYLDAIRKRANPSASNSLAAGSALLDSIYVERRKELAFEGVRMFDLLRWKKGVMRTDPLTPDVSSLSYPNNKAISPIPLTDVQNGIFQNDGY